MEFKVFFPMLKNRISYDKQGDCRPDTRECLERNAVLRLSTDGCELYGRSWNKEENIENEDELQ